jgi:hypothetical protein
MRPFLVDQFNNLARSSLLKQSPPPESWGAWWMAESVGG